MRRMDQGSRGYRQPHAPLEKADLLVIAVRHQAEGVISITLQDTDSLDLPPWEPGAHIDVRVPSGLIRQYSLCGDVADSTSYTVAVLREPDGRGGSLQLHDNGLVGRTLQVTGPRNHFRLHDSDDYLLIAGGIGITPILAIARSLDAAGRQWRMIYGGRSRRSMAFCAELERFGDKVELAPQDEVGLLPLESIVASVRPETQVYACGPTSLLDALSMLCVDRGVDLHLERFTTTPPVAGAVDDVAAGSFEVELRRTGVVLSVPAGRRMLDVIREVLPDTPYSCEEGYCGSCETRVLGGIPEHHDLIFDEREKATNKTMMICVGRSKSPLLVLDL